MKQSIIAAALMAAFSAQAGNQHQENHESHGAHVHGVAQLNVVLADNELQLMLETPAMNVMDFEYAPTSEADLTTSHEALHVLQDAKWVAIQGGNCHLHDSEVKWQHAEAVHAHFHADHHASEKNDKKAHKHEHHHEDKHEHQHEHGDSHDEAHSDIAVMLAFECEQPEAVKSLTLNAFEHFAGFEKVAVQWIADEQQGAQTLTPQHRVLKLR